VKSEKTSDKVSSEVSVLVRGLLFMSFSLIVSVLLFIFAGVGWAMLFFSLAHLVLTLIPFNTKIGKFMLGKNNYSQLENRLIRAKNSLSNKLYVSLSNLLLFFVTFWCFCFLNIRIIDSFIK